MRLIFCFLYLFANLHSVSLAQGNDSLRQTSLRMEVGGIGVSGNRTPFWLRANQYGIVPLSGSVGTVRLGITADYQPSRTDSAAPARRFDWGYGLDVVANAGTTTQLILPEAYVKMRFHQIEVYAGRRRTIVGLMDTTLSSGAYAWSGNALPIPVIQIGTIGYAPLKFTRGLVAVNAMFNHGWFTDGFVQNSYLHQKTLYGRLGEPNWRVKLYGGISHQVQWSGYAPGLGNDPGLSENGYLASGLRSYANVLISRRGADAYTTNPNVVSIDQGNRIGNQLGSVDAAVEFNVGAYTVMMYRQNPYETGALYYLTSIADGLNGIRFRRKQPGSGGFSVDHVLFEYFHSKSHGGPEFVIEDPKRRGRTDNFNHSQYRDGWTYQGRTIGTPFLSQRTEVRPNLATSAIANNRVSLVHVAASGSVNQRIAWLLKLSYSQNFGTYTSPYPAGINQFSGLVQVAAPIRIPALGECQLNASLAIDRGQLLYNSSGVYIGLRKTITSQPVQQSAPTAGSRMLRQ